MVSIGSSSSLQNILINMARTSGKVNSLSKKLSTGKAVNDGKDSAEAIHKLNQLTAEINGLNIANENASSTSNLLGTADGGLTAILSSLQQLRDTAVQASDGTISASDRANLSSNADALLSGIDQTASSLSYGDTNLLDGSFGTQTVQVGANEGDAVSVTLESATTSALGISGIDLSSDTSSGSAITTIDNAINQVISQMASSGSDQSRLENIQNTNNTSIDTLSQSRSNLQDLDYAGAVTLMAKLKIQQQAQLQVLGTAINSSSQTSKLSIRT